MATTHPCTEDRFAVGRNGRGLIDADVHTWAFPPDRDLCRHLSRRWRDYIDLVGLRNIAGSTQTPQQQPNAARRDAMPPNGGEAGSDPEFTRVQLLDAYDIDAAILNSFGCLGAAATGNAPAALLAELATAYNLWSESTWLESDPRWLSSICLSYEQPAAAIAEIERCVAGTDRFVQIMIASRTEHPIGNQKYWPLFEAATHFDLPVALHVGVCRTSQSTAGGMTNFYFEEHCDIAQQSFSIVPSLIFEGVFDRWPTLKIVLAELGWSWAVPLAWRLDASWRVLHDEVPHLQRTPSEYLREHFWFTSQPMEEPSRQRWFLPLYEQFERAGLGHRLMFSTDYPHWDFDSPTDSLPPELPESAAQRIFWDNAYALYRIPGLRPAADDGNGATRGA
jgi:predicted TIM-barrel fold metal-dependent hydrolase